MTWTTGSSVQHEEVREKSVDEQPEVKRHWLWPLLALVLIVILAGAGVYIFLRMSEKPPVIPVTENSTPIEQSSPIIPDTKAPVISNISVDSIAYNSVKIKWSTDEPSTSQVIWRTSDGKISSTDEKQAMVDQHVVELTELKNKQRYYFKVRSVDQSHNETVSVEETFDIGLTQGVAGIGVASDSMKTEEPQPSVFRTVISGKLVNTGEVPILTRNIEVWITITVGGKTGTSEIKAELDPTPSILNPLYEIGFRAVVPSRTDPKYTVTPKIIGQ